MYEAQLTLIGRLISSIMVEYDLTYEEGLRKAVCKGYIAPVPVDPELLKATKEAQLFTDQ